MKLIEIAKHECESGETYLIKSYIGVHEGVYWDKLCWIQHHYDHFETKFDDEPIKTSYVEKIWIMEEE